jgi:hypothetical protein
VCHVTVLPGQSRENIPNPPSAHLYSTRGGAGFSQVSPSPSCGPIGDAARPATQPIRMEETYHIFRPFLLIQGFLIEIYPL